MFFPKAHIHIGVGDTQRSVAFYEALLGARPARQSTGCAVFDLDSPPLVLTVEQESRNRPCQSHFALLVDDPRLVGNAAVALRRAGVRLRLGDQGVEALDPDGNAWRVQLGPTAAGLAVVSSERGRPK